MRQKLAAMMEDMPPEIRERSIRVFELLLAIAAQSEQPKPPSNATDSRQEASRPLTGELFDVFLNLLEDLGSNRSGVIVFDDLQWADEASVALLCHLFQLTRQTPLLFLCAFRPYRGSPAWKIKTTAQTDYPNRYTEINLGPLSGTDSQVLVEGLLQAVDLPSQVHQHILKKAEGNPFFVEEIVRSLIEKEFVVRDERGARWKSGMQVEDLAIPDNVQALLAARIDLLEKDLRRTLQLASVIGRSFYRRVLHWAMEAKGSMDEHLTAVQWAELIRRVAQVPELEYAFRHELTRDVAYQSILRRNRRRFHRRVGAALESLYPERLEELAPRLGYHFYEGRDDERALKYYAMAGHAAARLNANTEAAAHYDRALEVAQRSRAPNEQFIDLYTRRGDVLESSGKYEHALTNYRQLETLARERSDPALELVALIAQANVQAIPSARQDPRRGIALSERALSLARELNDRQAEVRLLRNLELLRTHL